MDISTGINGREQEITDFFTATFTASEGAEEGALIGELVRNLLNDTAAKDIFIFVADRDRDIAGCIIFSRLTYAEDDRTVFVLGPVAVATDRQRGGIGQRLLRHGLQALRGAGVDIVVTYGDPELLCEGRFHANDRNFRAGAVPADLSGRLAGAVADRQDDGAP